MTAVPSRELTTAGTSTELALAHRPDEVRALSRRAFEELALAAGESGRSTARSPTGRSG